MHGIIPKSLLNLLNSFHLGNAKLLAKFDTIPLVSLSVILQKLTIHRAFTTRTQLSTNCRRLMLSIGGKKFTHAHKSPLHIYNDGHFPCLIGL
jgi:hypothetical protein